jgi:hypothetical protein
MLVVNLWGAPGSGKSTTAAGIFNILKLNRISCELVGEEAKDLTWDSHKLALEDQAYVFGCQHHRLFRLQRNGIDVAIADSPLLMSLCYVPEDYPQSFRDMIVDFWERFDNLNYVIRRVKPYDPKGRNQDEAGSDRISEKIMGLIAKHGIAHRFIDGDEFAAPKIAEAILKRRDAP